jgi:hypothetical protein
VPDVGTSCVGKRGRNRSGWYVRLPGMAVRFGLGNPERMRSDSWSVRAGSDGSIYIAPRLLKKDHRDA